MTHERVLLIGDTDRQMYAALAQALPAAKVKSVGNMFDAIAELTHEQYTTILTAVEPIERRPEAAIRTLREVSGEGRLLLFGHPTLEPLSQKMLEFGCDDYLVTPATAGELVQLLNAPRAPVHTAETTTGEAPQDTSAVPAPASSPLAQIHVADVVLDALVQQPADALNVAIRQLNELLPLGISLALSPADAPAPPAVNGIHVITHRLPHASSRAGALNLTVPAGFDPSQAGTFLAAAGQAIAKLDTLQERHAGLQRLAITDDLTGLNNGRYFRHFLTKIIEKAKLMRFPVTLFLFDIDNFKKYNDQYGHGVGDEILRQTAALMKRCCRDHDLVARISGDEFAVVFWEKEGPRQPRDPKILPSARTPQEPQQILDRFRRLLSSQVFPKLGPAGEGHLTISGGLAVYPYDANTVDALIEAADQELMFGAKRSGRNSIHLVGGDQLPHHPANDHE